MGYVDPDIIHTEKGCMRYLGQLTPMSVKNRNRPTEAERKMWHNFLSNDKTGFRFLRQKPIHRFIVDFYCVKLDLAIEIDGSSHDKKREADILRDKFLNQIGIKTIRFTNDQVLNDPDYIKNVLFPPC